MHKLTKTGLLAAVFACVSVGSAAENEWSTPLDAALVKPGEKAPTATDCGGDVPCVRLWSQMSADERAKLWPYLDEVSRASHWREMNRTEREALKTRLCPRDVEALRHRFTLKSTEECAESGPKRLRSRMADEADRRLMREQILEVHMELSGAEHRSHPRALRAPEPIEKNLASGEK